MTFCGGFQIHLIRLMNRDVLQLQFFIIQNVIDCTKHFQYAL